MSEAYGQSPGGALHIKIGGNSAGSGFDRLDITGSASLDGRLVIDTLSGFTPAQGDSFQIVNYALRRGQFATVEGSELGGGLFYDLQYNADNLTLVVRQRTVAIDDVVVTEGDAETVAATFTVSLSHPSRESVSIDFAAADGTATTGTDHQTTSGTLTFAPGVTTRTVTVLVNGDTGDEFDETFFVNLTNPANATLADAQGVGTIVDDDIPPGVHDVGIRAFRTAGRSQAGRTRTVTIKIENFGTAVETSVPFSLTGPCSDAADGCAAGGLIYSSACSGDAATLSPDGNLDPGETVTVVGCSVTYPATVTGASDTYSHTLTVSHDPSHGGSSTDADPTNNSRTRSTRVVP